MRFLIAVYLTFICLIIFSSCSYKQDQILFEQRNALRDTTTQKDAATVSTYLIKPQDLLQIRNLQNINYIVDNAPTSESNSTANSETNNSSGQIYQVEADGNVALPEIGRVQVVGLTRIEATRKIEDLYKKILLKNPIIDIKIVNLKVTILGEIKTQGNYPLIKDKTTLVEMIGEAGGITERANGKNVKIIRGTQKNPKIINVDLSDIRSLTDSTTNLQNGDVIYIAQNKRAVRSDNLQNFSIVLQPILILLNTALIIFTLAHR
jgi:polysaccharide export outer membrane protein